MGEVIWGRGVLSADRCCRCRPALQPAFHRILHPPFAQGLQLLFRSFSFFRSFPPRGQLRGSKMTMGMTGHRTQPGSARGPKGEGAQRQVGRRQQQRAGRARHRSRGRLSGYCIATYGSFLFTSLFPQFLVHFFLIFSCFIVFNLFSVFLLFYVLQCSLRHISSWTDEQNF